MVLFVLCVVLCLLAGSELWRRGVGVPSACAGAVFRILSCSLSSCFVKWTLSSSTRLKGAVCFVSLNFVTCVLSV